MRARFKSWSEPFILENPDIAVCDANLNSSQQFLDFLKRDNLFMEIGPGKGGFMMNLAAKYPQYNFICVEKCISVAGQFAKLLKNADLKNVFIVACDIVNVTPFINKHCISTIFLNHPDPWPKKRHEKRRLTSKGFLTFYKDFLKDYGILILKTDNEDMFNFSIDELTNENWNIFELNRDYLDDDPFDAVTNYEAAWRVKGVKIKRLKAKYQGEKL